jgi:D-aminopeptidase
MCSVHAQTGRVRDLGIIIGVLPPGPNNTITDVAGVRVGHKTLVSGGNIRTGVTVIVPHDGNPFREKIPAAIFIGNGFGKLAGFTQVKELGNIETPIVLTNTLSVPAASEGLLTYVLSLPGNEEVRSVNAVVGETNDGYLNDIRGRHVKPTDILDAIRDARDGKVAEGNVGAGTGTIAFGFKGGIGTSSRKLPAALGGYTLGVLVQTNFGGVLQIDGVPVGEELGKFAFSDVLSKSDGSCMIVVITDAPLDARNLERVAKRAMMGLARTGGIASNGSGDYVIAMSVARENLIIEGNQPYQPVLLHNEAVTPLFLAAIEATEEAILNSMFAAETMTGYANHQIQRLPVDKVMEIMKRHQALKK